MPPRSLSKLRGFFDSNNAYFGSTSGGDRNIATQGPAWRHQLDCEENMPPEAPCTVRKMTEEERKKYGEPVTKLKVKCRMCGKEVPFRRGNRTAYCPECRKIIEQRRLELETEENDNDRDV